jgi:hypothetical protein
VFKDKLVQERYAAYAGLKAGLACSVCGETHPACLDFHHRDPYKKSFNLAEGWKTRTWQEILDEVDKCDILCANCHRKHHSDRMKSRGRLLRSKW